MKNVQPGMNVARQRRKIQRLRDNAPDAHHARYLDDLLSRFDRAADDGQPRPASDFIPQYHEEFDVDAAGRSQAE